MAYANIINFENKLRLGHVKVSSGNGSAFGLELGEPGTHFTRLRQASRHRRTSMHNDSQQYSLKHYYTIEREHKFGGNIEVHV